jgi:polyphosphate kinase
LRDEHDGLRRYAHIGTGNYNPKTARMYEDMGLLTCNPIITDDVARLFNHLSGMTREDELSPAAGRSAGIRNGLIENIGTRSPTTAQGCPPDPHQGELRGDEATIDASTARPMPGSRYMWVRGICAVRPACRD